MDTTQETTTCRSLLFCSFKSSKSYALAVITVIFPKLTPVRETEIMGLGFQLLMEQ